MENVPLNDTAPIYAPSPEPAVPMSNGKFYRSKLFIGIAVALIVILGIGIYLISQGSIKKLFSTETSGKIHITFKKDVTAATANAEFQTIGIPVSESMFKSDRTLVATPHRGDAKLYGKQLEKDPLVKSVDYSNTDDNLKQYKEKIKEDTAYLYVTFKQPMSSDEVLKWEKEKFPKLVDVSLKDKSNTMGQNSNGLVTVINTENGQLSYGGTNPWAETLSQTVMVAKGKEKEMLKKILTFSTVEKAEIAKVENTDCKDGPCPPNRPGMPNLP
ncbi:MAG: hypothetical protein WCP09_00385 [Candidatus Taylorbacteria bacterium]